MIYIGAGGADTKGVTADWVLIAIRAVYMLAALVAYTAYTWETSPALLRHTVERSDL
ncbi:MAG: hypothetical protein M5R36_09285 [Deltaproteobacteria bacterium]|nr:hypothetical protein [Deltaproteobacteria bacterium]